MKAYRRGIGKTSAVVARLSGIALALALSSCAKTTLYQRGIVGPNGKGVPLAEFQGNYQGLSLVDQFTQFGANSMAHAEETRAGAEWGKHAVDATKAIGSAYAWGTFNKSLGKVGTEYFKSRGKKIDANKAKDLASEETKRAEIQAQSENSARLDALMQGDGEAPLP